MGDCRLRPVQESDLDCFEAEFSDRAGTGEYQWFGYHSPRGVRERFARTGLLEPEGGVLTVCWGDEVAGRVEWFPGYWGRRETSMCWTIAIGLRPVFQGRGIGTEAQRLLVAYLFDHTRAHRIQAFTDADNLAEQRALEKAGFTREGVMRGWSFLGGRYRDEVLYSVLRGDL
jgi:aminoglycoside 6'-N-acetyltransferase